MEVICIVLGTRAIVSLQMLLPEEIEVLVCGNPCFSLEGLEKVTVFDGYNPNDKTIKYAAYF